MCVAWIGHEIERAIINSPHQGAKDGPTQPYPTPRTHGRGPHGTLLPHRRRLRRPQPPRPLLRLPQASLGLGGHHLGTLSTAAGHRERALVLARCPEVLLASVPRRGWVAPLLVPSALEEAQALPGAPAPRRALRDGRRAGDFARRLYVAFGLAPQAGFSGLGLSGRRVGKVGFVQCLWREAPCAVLDQRSSYLLRAHPRKRRGRLPDRGAHR